MKISPSALSNAFCPQALYLFGTYTKEGRANFALFSWVSFCMDEQLHVMACIGGEKLTKTRIEETKMFSANLVSRKMLPASDFFGNVEGTDPRKQAFAVESYPGEKLHVPIYAQSPWSYELQVEQAIALHGSVIYLCAIRNVLAQEELLDDSIPLEERMRLADPVLSAGRALERYFSLNPAPIGKWAQWANLGI